MRMNRFARAGSILGLALIALVLGSYPVTAQQATGRIVVKIKAADARLKDRPVMVSAIREGAIVDQKEILLVEAPNEAGAILQRVPAGTCDVRIEGDGIVTEAKRGIQVFAGRDADLSAVARPGTGVHTVEYAVGGLSREEVAARLSGLEAAAAALRRDLEQVAAAAAARAKGN